MNEQLRNVSCKLRIFGSIKIAFPPSINKSMERLTFNPVTDNLKGIWNHSNELGEERDAFLVEEEDIQHAMQFRSQIGKLKKNTNLVIFNKRKL